MAFLPQHALERLAGAHRAGRLAHAYLICGGRGSGKDWLVGQMTAILLGQDPDKALKHPDAHVAEPESRSRRILIEQIRRLDHAIREKPSAGRLKVAIIRDADRLQPQAANAFLKTLEEPPPGTHLFLTSASPGALLDTIVSRCITLHLRAPAAPEPSGAELELLDALESAALTPGSSAGAAFRLARKFLEVLEREREAIREEFEEAFKQDQAHYQKTTDGSWLDAREDQLKALVEASALRRRAALIQAIANWHADVLRIQHGARPVLDRPAQARAAELHEAREMLRRISAIEETISDLDRGVQEPLAVEAGFLRLFDSQP
jgi:DNA polymerase-3 subunit delta'